MEVKKIADEEKRLKEAINLAIELNNKGLNILFIEQSMRGIKIEKQNEIHRKYGLSNKILICYFYCEFNKKALVGLSRDNNIDFIIINSAYDSVMVEDFAKTIIDEGIGCSVFLKQ